jgi:hypothetical protein
LSGPLTSRGPLGDAFRATIFERTLAAGNEDRRPISAR